MLAPLNAIGAVLGILGGLALAGWALFSDRSHGIPRCPKCWYLMIGATGLRCPECGHVVAETGEFYHTRRRWRWACLGVASALAAPAYTWGVPHWDELLLAILPRWHSLGRLPFEPFTVEVYNDRRSARPMQVRIQRNGEREFTLTAWDLDVGADTEDDSRAAGVGEDITGDGIPNLILSEWTGGSHCCWTYHILSLDPNDGARVVATIWAGHYPATFEDLDGDGRLECILSDWTFAWWNGSSASPSPEVILCCRGGQYVVAAHLMGSPGPSETTLIEQARRLRDETGKHEWNRGGVPVEYWAEMLELIFIGHEALAWRFAEEAWPKNQPGKEEFLERFRRQLAESPYWPAIRTVSLP
ncbi:MAG: hypothetical protein ABIG44_17570 [Planctomycetota bacterium]